MIFETCLYRLKLIRVLTIMTDTRLSSQLSVGVRETFPSLFIVQSDSEFRDYLRHKQVIILVTHFLSQKDRHKTDYLVIKSVVKLKL